MSGPEEVLLGETYTYTATPTGSGWPANEPTWSVSGSHARIVGSSTGPSVQVIFEEAEGEAEALSEAGPGTTDPAGGEDLENQVICACGESEYTFTSTVVEITVDVEAGEFEGPYTGTHPVDDEKTTITNGVAYVYKNGDPGDPVGGSPFSVAPSIKSIAHTEGQKSGTVTWIYPYTVGSVTVTGEASAEYDVTFEDDVTTSFTKGTVDGPIDGEHVPDDGETVFSDGTAYLYVNGEIEEGPVSVVPDIRSFPHTEGHYQGTVTWEHTFTYNNEEYTVSATTEYDVEFKRGMVRVVAGTVSGPIRGCHVPDDAGKTVFGTGKAYLYYDGEELGQSPVDVEPSVTELRHTPGGQYGECRKGHSPLLRSPLLRALASRLLCPCTIF